MKKIILVFVALSITSAFCQPSKLFKYAVFYSTEFVDTLGVELLTNGDMELNSNWTGFGLEGGDVSEQSTTQIHGGTYSWHINVDADGEGMYSDDFNVEAGKTYWVSFWFYLVGGSAAISPYYGSYSGNQSII